MLFKGPRHPIIDEKSLNIDQKVVKIVFENKNPKKNIKKTKQMSSRGGRKGGVCLECAWSVLGVCLECA